MADEAERQLVVFDLAGEAYGVNIGTVREIIRMQAVTHVPETPDFVEGVINLRGEICPVVDLKRLLGLPEHGLTNATNAVILHDAAMEFGVVADRVTDWGAQTPVPEWKARDVVAHLVEWVPGFLGAAGVSVVAAGLPAWLPRVASGEALVAFAWQERAGRYRTDVCTTTAQEAGGAWELIKVNTDQHPAIAEEQGIQSLPTIRIFKDGKAVAEKLGRLPREADAVRRPGEDDVAGLQHDVLHGQLPDVGRPRPQHHRGVTALRGNPSDRVG